MMCYISCHHSQIHSKLQVVQYTGIFPSSYVFIILKPFYIEIQFHQIYRKAMLRVFIQNLHAIFEGIFSNIYTCIIQSQYKQPKKQIGLFICQNLMNNILLFCKLGFILKNICYFNPVCVYKNTKICLSRDYFIVFENVTLTVKKYPSK